jgi:tubulin polyglutamylase TTLL9
MHLTNVAIQKTADNYDEKLGGKWELRNLKLFLMAKFGASAVNSAFT